MKTINGKNKEERLINKTKKYIDINLVSTSNKYLRATTENDDVVVVQECTWKMVNTKYGVKYVINLTNLEKAIWVSSFAAIELAGGELAFKLYKPDQTILNVIKGCEDIIKMIDYQWDKTFKIAKNWTNFYACQNVQINTL